MSLSNARPNLETAILAAFDHAFQIAKNAGSNDVSSQIRKELAKDLANAIHAYVTKADVNISSIEGAGLGVTLQSKAFRQALERRQLQVQ
jgi:hypothetical protein